MDASFKNDTVDNICPLKVRITGFKFEKQFLIITVLLFSVSAFGQGYDHSYVPREYKKAFSAGTRVGNGRPAVNYWQNRASYLLRAELTTPPHNLKGEGQITYYNNSPDTLNAFILKILQDVQKEGNSRDFNIGPKAVTDGVVIHNLTVDGVKPRTVMRGTNLIVLLARERKLPPGGKLEIDVSWSYEIPTHAIRNGAYTDSSFFIGYWYPQMAVYDDIMGWDQEQYTGRTETYNDLADYQVEIKVPEEYLVWATGSHVNEEKVYSREILRRIANSRRSDSIVSIVTQGDLLEGNLFAKGYDRTWRFSAGDVPDFAFATSNYYLWDAGSVEVEKNRRIWVNAVYAPGAAGFDRVADIARESISYFSKVFPGIPYPWDKHITYNGMVGGGMEYPMMANNMEVGVDEGTIEITAHEIAHTYLPFYTLSNERNQEWLDEGWVKLMGELFAESKGFPRSSRMVLNSIGIYNLFAGSYYDTPLINPSSFISPLVGFQHNYAKASVCFSILLDLFREKGVNDPLRQFLIAWKGKHPSPYDFFDFMSSLAEEDLGWFWEPWFFRFAYPDLGIARVDGSKGIYEVEVINRGGLPLPVILDIEYTDKTTDNIQLTPSAWKNTNRIIIPVHGEKEVEKLSLGTPLIPDINNSDNYWNRETNPT